MIEVFNFEKSDILREQRIDREIRKEEYLEEKRHREILRRLCYVALLEIGVTIGFVMAASIIF